MYQLLLLTIAQGNVVLANKLIDLMSEVDFKKDYSNLCYNQIPLHYAVYLKRNVIVDKLLSVRPELIKVIDKDGKNALDIAISIPNNEIVVNNILRIINKILTYKLDLHSTVDECDNNESGIAAVSNLAQLIGKLLAVEIILDTVTAKHNITRFESKKNNVSNKLTDKEMKELCTSFGLKSLDSFESEYDVKTTGDNS